MKGCTVTVKVRYPDFTTVTRSVTLPLPTDQGIEIYQTALKLLHKTEALQRKARLLGVGISSLLHAGDPEQLSFFDGCRKKVRMSTTAMDRIWDKFGEEAIKRASLLEKK